MNDLEGKTILITGGTSGIGEACAKRCATAGAFVIVVGRNIEHGTVVVDEIVSNNGKAMFVPMDISNLESINEAYSTIANKFITIDVLVNNAGAYYVDSEFEKIDDCFNSKIITDNLEGTIMVTKKFLPMIIQQHGNIIFNASIGGIDSYTNGGGYLYSASKAGVIKFAKLLAKNYGSVIRVNTICPGVVKTPFYTFFDENKYKEKIPMRRVGTPDDIAKVVNFLVSNDACYINGAVLTVDGGMSL